MRHFPNSIKIENHIRKTCGKLVLYKKESHSIIDSSLSENLSNVSSWLVKNLKAITHMIKLYFFFCQSYSAILKMADQRKYMHITK